MLNQALSYAVVNEDSETKDALNNYFNEDSQVFDMSLKLMQDLAKKQD